MIYVAKLDNSVVVEVFITDEEYSTEVDEIIVGEVNKAGIGYIYNKGEFSPPIQTEE